MAHKGKSKGKAYKKRKAKHGSRRNKLKKVTTGAKRVTVRRKGGTTRVQPNTTATFTKKKKKKKKLKNKAGIRG